MTVTDATIVESAFAVIDAALEADRVGRMSVQLSRFRSAFLACTTSNESMGVPEHATLTDVDLANTSVALVPTAMAGEVFFARFSLTQVSAVHDLCHDRMAFSGRRLFKYDVAGVQAGRDLVAFSMVLIQSRDGFACVGGWASGRSARQSKSVRSLLSGNLLETANMAVPTILGIDFAREMCWTVSFSIPGLGASLAFLTDAIGVREALALRDLEPGKQRRAALAHWVSAHNRKQRNDPDATDFVRRHLRGRWECSLSGMDVLVGAPPEEIRLAALERTSKEAP